MNYTITIKRNAQKALAQIGQPYRTNIIENIRSLAINPRPPNCKKLTERNAWKIRIGSFRVVYEIKEAELVIIVVNVGHRKEVYR